jgi:hypothetical protein
MKAQKKRDMDLKLNKISKIWAYENRIKSKKAGRGTEFSKEKWQKRQFKA